MLKESKITKIIKISSLAYSALTILFFILTNLAAGFIGQGKTDGIYYVMIMSVQLLVYVELFGYFAIIVMVFLYLLRKNKYAKMRQLMPASEKFPTAAFLVSLLFFFIFMSLMSYVLG